MLYGPGVFSALFFISFAVYIFLGLYIFLKTTRTSRSVLFLIINLALGLWSLGYAFAIPAANLQTSLIWYRFSAVGWTLFYALILHFSIILTDKRAASARLPLLVMIYLPAMFFLFNYALSPGLADKLFQLQSADAGWINRPGSSPVELGFTVYYSSYLAISLFLIIMWGAKTNTKMVRSQSKLLSVSIVFAVLFGSLFDRYYIAAIDTNLPQLAPIFIMLPALSVYYAISHFGFFDDRIVNEDEIILNNRSRINIYNKLVWFLLAGGVISVPLQYFLSVRHGYSEVSELFFPSGAFLASALLVHLINRLKYFEGIREPLFALAQAAIMPFLILRYAHIASVTVWIVPVISIILAVLYNSRFALAAVTGSSAAAIILIMIGAPDVLVQIDISDHIARLIILAVIVLGAVQVNRHYVARLKQNADQIQLQKQISEMTNLMLDADEESINDKMTELLHSSAEFIQADGGAIYFFDEKKGTSSRVFSWHNTDHYIFDDDQSIVSIDHYGWINERVDSDGFLIIRTVDDIPSEGALMRQYFERFGIKSLMIKRLREGQKIIGTLTFSSTTKSFDFEVSTIEFINILSNIAASAIEHVRHESVIRSLAYFDALTGLVNRSHFFELAAERLEQASRNNKHIAVAFMDLDAFKSVNDSVGHDGGDELLRRLALQMGKSVRASDLLGRFGGDEFLLLLDPVENEKDSLELIAPILSMFQEPFKLRGNRYQVTVSAGLALYPRDGQDLEMLIQNADLAMYEAKSLGKNQAFFCNESLKAENERQVLLANDLHTALEENQLFLYYQPQIELETGRIKGAEALLRWQHPQFGLVPPGAFIPLAEKNGMIHSIGEYVIRQACIQGKKWQNTLGQNFTVAVNLSLRQLISDSLVGKIDRILAETDFDPGLLELEITESTASIGLIESTQILAELKSLGIRLAIDDFGTQYSSLNRIRQLPIDTIKIDRQFIWNLDINQKDTAIVELIINLAKRLGIAIVAEGVETRQQLEYLDELGCDCVQGFYYYRPMPVSEIDKLLL